MSNTSALPKRLPVLKAKDIHRGTLSSPDNKSFCLLGWAKKCHGLESSSYDDLGSLPISQSMLRFVGNLGHPTLHASPARRIYWFSDATPKSKAASVWNRAAKSLGYRLSKCKRFFYLPAKQIGGAK